uniref:Uncharacterized protein n=1 Tax=Arion vulgaris TaxID=1028688 RepID=A0A0B7BMW8_9EUPU
MFTANCMYLFTDFIFCLHCAKRAEAEKTYLNRLSVEDHFIDGKQLQTSS